jgi:hypothetical protein
MKKKMIEVVQYLKDMDKEKERYLDTVPEDLRAVLLDNQYLNLLEMTNDRLLKALFKKDTDEVCWFLYEYHESKPVHGPHVIQEDGTAHTFHSNEDYYTYLKDFV